jgi:hypothetical protein
MVNVSSGEATNKRQTAKHFNQNKQYYQASISSSKLQAKQANSRTISKLPYAYFMRIMRI